MVVFGVLPNTLKGRQHSNSFSFHFLYGNKIAFISVTHSVLGALSLEFQMSQTTLSRFASSQMLLNGTRGAASTCLSQQKVIH